MNIVKNLVPAVLNGEVLQGYFLHKKDCTLWSYKKGRGLIQLKDCIDNGGYVSNNIKKKPVYRHRIVAHTLLEFPIPPGVSKTDWNNTPESVKSILGRKYLVNHIDHDRSNYHVSNLEYTDHKGNADAAVEHKRKHG